MVNFLSPRQFVAVVLVAWMWISMGFCSSVVINSEMFSIGKMISYGLFTVAVCFAQGDPSQRSWEYSILSSEVGTSHVCSHEGACLYHFGEWKPLNSTAFLMNILDEFVSGLKAGIVLKCLYPQQMCRDSQSDSHGSVGPDSAIKLVSITPLQSQHSTQQLPSDGRRRLACSDAQSSFPPRREAAWNSFASKVLRAMI